MRKHIYLACPYRGTKEEIEHRMNIVKDICTKIRNDGNYVTSPLLHHFIFDENNNVSDGNYWLDYSRDLIKSITSTGETVPCELWILPLDGWMESSGIRMEIKTWSETDYTTKFIDTDFNLTDISIKCLVALLDKGGC